MGDGVAVAATASSAPARHTLRRVRIVGGLVMSISRLKALRASAEAVAFVKIDKNTMSFTIVFLTCSDEMSSLRTSCSGGTDQISANWLNKRLIVSHSCFYRPQPRAHILTAIVDCKRNRDVLT